MAERGLLVAFFFCMTFFITDHVIRSLKKKPFKPRCVAFVTSNNDPERLEAVLMYAYDKLKCGFASGSELYFIEEGCNEEELKIANAFCRDHYAAFVTSRENIQDIVDDSVYKTVRFVIY